MQDYQQWADAKVKYLFCRSDLFIMGQHSTNSLIIIRFEHSVVSFVIVWTREHDAWKINNKTRKNWMPMHTTRWHRKDAQMLQYRRFPVGIFVSEIV